ncbi:MAG: hypothetical protein PWQ16_1032 [bacterium]|nr:MAG: Major facilitator superfamily MFS_1 [bacterium 42_11]MDK2871680.1 hypothetical protein [bacterium]
MKNIITLTITINILVCSLFSWYFLLPVYLKTLGASEKVINIAYFLFNLTFYIGQIPGGVLSDKLGRKPVIVATTLLYALSGYGMYLSSNWLEASIFYSLACISSSVQLPAIYAMIFESQKRRGFSFGMTSFSYNLGIALGPLLGAFLIKKGNIRDLLLLYSVTALIVSILRLTFLEETLSRQQKLKEKDKIKIGRQELLILTGGIFFFLSVSLTINGPYISLFLKEGLSLSEQEINLTFTKIGIATALTCLVLGKIIDFVDSAKTWAITSFLHPLTLFLWSYYFKLSMGILIISCILAEAAYIAHPILVSRMFPKEQRGKGLGFFGFITGSIGSVSPLLVNLFDDKKSLYTPFVLATLFGFLSFWFIIKSGGGLKNEPQQK